MWGDGAKLDQPQYYETLCTGDVDGDGQDEMIIRGPAGILVNQFDPQTGQWVPLTSYGPMWSDFDKDIDWTKPQYYQTIKCADVDGDGQAEIMACGPSGLIGYRYDNNTSSNTYRQFIALPILTNWSDANNWNLAESYETIRFGNLDGSGKKMAIWRNTSAALIKSPVVAS